MAAWPFAILGMFWLATRDKTAQRPAHEIAQEEYDQRPSTYVKVYDIDGFDYCVYRISDPDGGAYDEYAGQDKMYFIAEKSDDPISTILETSAGPATYQTLPQARSALDSLHEGMTSRGSMERGESQIYESASETLDDGTKITKSKAKKADLSKEQDRIVVAEGREEGAILEEIDVTLYDGDGSITEMDTIETQAVVNQPTDLRSSI